MGVALKRKKRKEIEIPLATETQANVIQNSRKIRDCFVGSEEK